MKVDEVDGKVDGNWGASVTANVQVSALIGLKVDEVDGKNENYAHMRAHAPVCAHPRTTMETICYPSTSSTSLDVEIPTPVVRGGQAVVDGVIHTMRVAMPSRYTARRYGLSTNHSARVWCSCYDHPATSPGYWSERPASEVENDPRRLGAYDWLDVVDTRIPNSALDVFKAHLREVAHAQATRNL